MRAIVAEESIRPAWYEEREAKRLDNARKMLRSKFSYKRQRGDTAEYVERKRRFFFKTQLQ